MSGGEYMDRESIDRYTRHVSDVQRIENMLESMTPDEVDTTVHVARAETVASWEGCNTNFEVLFEILNSCSRQPIDRFDIKIGHEQFGDSTFEGYLSVWKDNREGTYKTRPKVRIDGKVEDSYFENVESFGDTYVYKYGTAHSHTATIKMQDVIGGGVKLERQDGKLVEGTSRHETAVLLAAIESIILPSVQKARDTLVLLWESLQNDEWNPVHAKSLQAYLDSHEL